MSQALRVSHALCVSAAAAVCLMLPLTSLRADPPSLAAADAAFAQGKFDQARRTYQSLLKTDPALPAPRLGLIQSLLRLDRWQDALRAAQEATQALPASADVHGLLAMTEIRAGQPEAALTDANLALAKDRDCYWGLVAAGRVADWEGREKEAYVLFTRATTLHPERPDGWLGAWQTINDPGITEADLQIAKSYLALAPKGQPFDFNTSYIQNIVTNETGYWHGFDKDPPFHLDEADQKQQSYMAVFPIQRSGKSVLVSVGINGKPFHLLFDTGASNLLLSSNAARRLGLTNLAKTSVSGVQGRAPASLQRADTLTLGSITLHSIPLTVTGSVPEDGDGIFGGSLLRDYAITLDFVDNTMTIARGHGAMHLAMANTTVAATPLHFYNSHLFVSTHAQGRRVWAMLDTGAYTDIFSLNLTHDLSSDTARSDWREGSYEERIGIGDSAMQIDYCVTPKKLNIAFDGSSPPATLTQDGLIGQSSIDHQISPSFGFEIGMILGVPVLSQHNRVTIDYPHRLLTLEDPK